MRMRTGANIRKYQTHERGRAPYQGKRRYIDYILFKDFLSVFEKAFPYLPVDEINRFVQLVFHEIVNTMHEKRVFKIPFFGSFVVKPKRTFKIYKRDVWNGYGEWIDLDTPIDDWVPTFEPSPYTKHMCSQRFTLEGKCEGDEDFVEQSISTTEIWDKFYIKFKKRDQALKENCPYSLSTMGWAGYKYERILKEGLNAGETIGITNKDGEVYNIVDGVDGNFNAKFKDAYEKTKYYMTEVAKRRINNLRKRNGMLRTWYKTYSNYLLSEKYKDVQELENHLDNRRKNGILTCFFYVLKFGYRFDSGEKKRIYTGYYFNPYSSEN